MSTNLNQKFLEAIIYRNDYTKQLEKGANINTTDEDGNSALMLAARYNYYLTFKSLLRLGIDINLKNKDGKTVEDFIKCPRIKKILKAWKNNESIALI